MSALTTFLQMLSIGAAIAGGTINYLILRDIRSELKGLNVTLSDVKAQMVTDRVCPFCGENNSFAVSDPHSTYFCFSCRKYGDTTRLVDDSHCIWEEKAQK
jgi:CHC2 zinc finger